MVLKVKVCDLKALTNKIFDHMQNDLKIEEVDIEEDMYWEVPETNRYLLLEEPKKLDVGQLYHDWGFLRTELSTDRATPTIMLLHLAPILRYLGDKVGQ